MEIHCSVLRCDSRVLSVDLLVDHRSSGRCSVWGIHLAIRLPWLLLPRGKDLLTRLFTSNKHSRLVRWDERVLSNRLVLCGNGNG